jgi:hypothetical protein
LLAEIEKNTEWLRVRCELESLNWRASVTEKGRNIGRETKMTGNKRAQSKIKQKQQMK